MDGGCGAVGCAASRARGGASSAAVERADPDEPDEGEGERVDVCSLVFRQAVALGAEAAVDELLGNADSACARYRPALLLLDGLLAEPALNAPDRASVEKLVAAFAARLADAHALAGQPLAAAAAVGATAVAVATRERRGSAGSDGGALRLPAAVLNQRLAGSCEPHGSGA